MCMFLAGASCNEIRANEDEGTFYSMMDAVGELFHNMKWLY